MLGLARSKGRCADTQTSMEIATAWIPVVCVGPGRDALKIAPSRAAHGAVALDEHPRQRGLVERPRAWLPSSAGASYDRSDCYQRVPEARYDPSVCWHVWPLVDLDPPSVGYSALSCRRRTRARYHTDIALDDVVLIRTSR
jgi:hypothetical protein